MKRTPYWILGFLMMLTGCSTTPHQTSMQDQVEIPHFVRDDGREVRDDGRDSEGVDRHGAEAADPTQNDPKDPPSVASASAANVSQPYIPAIDTAAADQAISKLINAVDKDARVGLHIKSLTYNQDLYIRDNNQLFVPASVSKLFTAAAASAYLGDDFHYLTQIYWSEHLLSQGVLRGDVYWRFSGDPMFGVSDMESIVKRLKAQGIRHIEGDIVLDDTAFDDVGQGPGWMWDDSHYHFGVSVTPMIIDENKVNLVINRKGQSIQVRVTHDYRAAFRVINELVPIGEENPLCPITITSDAYNQIHVRGCVPKNKSHISERLAIYNVPLYVRVLLNNLFIESGITWTGNIGLGKTPNGLRAKIVHQSEPLPAILREVLAHSHNLATGSLQKTLGAEVYGPPGTWQKGAGAIAQVLEPSGIDFERLDLRDGTGVSRYNLIRPSQLVQLLEWVHQNPELEESMRATLAKRGEGTIGYRAFHRALQDKLWVKTGSMTGVSAITGYVERPDGELLAFAIMINGFVGPRKPYADLEKRIIEYFALG